MPFVYILKDISSNNWHYVGSCHDLAKRVKQHHRGNVKSTKYHRPLELIYTEEFDGIEVARKRELFLKSPKGYLSKKRIIENCIKPG